MQQQTDKKDRRIIDLMEYRQGRENRQAQAAEEAAAEDPDEILTKVSYYLLMAARTIAQQRKH